MLRSKAEHKEGHTGRVLGTYIHAGRQHGLKE